MGVLAEFMFFSSAILLKGDFRVNGSRLIGDLYLDVCLCSMAIAKSCVLQPCLYVPRIKT